MILWQCGCIECRFRWKHRSNFQWHPNNPNPYNNFEDFIIFCFSGGPLLFYATMKWESQVWKTIFILKRNKKLFIHHSYYWQSTTFCQTSPNIGQFCSLILKPWASLQCRVRAVWGSLGAWISQNWKLVRYNRHLWRLSKEQWYILYVLLHHRKFSSWELSSLFRADSSISWITIHVSSLSVEEKTDRKIGDNRPRRLQSVSSVGKSSMNSSTFQRAFLFSTETF